MLLVRIVAWGVSALVSLRYALGLYAWRVSEKLEKPRYESLLQLPGGVEIRRYEPYTVVEATFRDQSMRAATGSGFRACAGFIFGGRNRVGGGPFSKRSSRSMAMTAPVRMETSERTTPEVKVPFKLRSSRVSERCLSQSSWRYTVRR